MSKQGDTVKFIDHNGIEQEGKITLVQDQGDAGKPILTVDYREKGTTTTRTLSGLKHESDRGDSADGKKVNCYSVTIDTPKEPEPTNEPQTEAPQKEDTSGNDSESNESSK